MNRIFQIVCLCAIPFSFTFAQPENNMPSTQGIPGNPTNETNEEQTNNQKAGLLINPKLVPIVQDGAYERITHLEREALAYPHLREADVMWSKRIWREIDTKEKMNRPFRSEYNSLIEVLLTIADKHPDIQLFDSDDFTHEVPKEAIASRMNAQDSVEVWNMDTEQYEWKVVNNALDLSTFEKFRIKEDWIFNSKTSKMECRIIGIAPVRTVMDPNTGAVRGQETLFWMHYPSIRKYLAKEEAHNPYNDAITISWQQLFDLRIFSSLIIKESNPRDRRIQDYAMGPDALKEAEKIKEDLYNFEFDLWSH